MRRSLPVAVAALTLTAAGIGLGWVLADDGGTGEAVPAGEAPFAVTALADLDTTTLTVPRAAFCGEVDGRQVAAAPTPGAPAWPWACPGPSRPSRPPGLAGVGWLAG